MQPVVGTVVNQVEIARLPLAIRNWDDLLAMVPGVQSDRYTEQSGRLGYYAFTPFAGTGLMFEGLRIVIRRAFRELGLHRLEANIQRNNVRSIALVVKLGFEREGTARRFLKIGNRWRDHERWALLKEDWRN